MAQVTHVQFLPLYCTLFFVYNDFGDNVCFLSFHSNFIIFLPLFFHVREWKEHSFFFSVRDWKYANLLQQWSFTHCQNSVEHIRLGWQVCTTLDGTPHKCNESKRTFNEYLHDTLAFCTFCFSHGDSPTYSSFYTRLSGKFHLVRATPSTGTDQDTVIWKYYHTKRTQQKF
jgi:hypothetical protein